MNYCYGGLAFMFGVGAIACAMTAATPYWPVFLGASLVTLLFTLDTY